MHFRTVPHIAFQVFHIFVVVHMALWVFYLEIWLQCGILCNSKCMILPCHECTATPKQTKQNKIFKNKASGGCGLRDDGMCTNFVAILFLRATKRLRRLSSFSKQQEELRKLLASVRLR